MVQDNPILLHAHVPKTAGESLVDLFSKNFGERVLRFEYTDPVFVLSPNELDRLCSTRADLIAISSHNLRVFPSVVGGRHALYFTMLRHPVDTFLSLLKYVRRDFHRFTDEVRRYWPKNTPECTLRELAEHAMWEAGVQGQYCLQTRFFCPPAYVNIPIGYDLNIYGACSFVIASSCLDRFFHVGIVEEMDQTMELLAAKLARAGISLEISDLEKINVTRVREDELEWINRDDEVGRSVLDSHISDFRIYDRSKKRLAEEYELFKRQKTLFVFGGDNDANAQKIGSRWTSVWEAPEVAQLQKAIREFSTWDRMRANQRRVEHLASLGSAFQGKTVWEVSAGIGDLSSFFLDRKCSLTITEVRPILLAILRERLPSLSIEELDLEFPSENFDQIFDIVFCYGCLSCVRNPDVAIGFMAKRCREVLLLEASVSFGDGIEVSPISEDSSAFSSAYHGTGCRPTRAFIFAELQKHFEHVYVTVQQPCHEEFPIDWGAPLLNAEEARAVFVASRAPLQSPKLVTSVPTKQTYIP